MNVRALAALVPGSPGGRSVLLAAVACFGGLRLAETAGALPGWLASWGDDILCLPLVLTLVLAVHRLAGRPPAWTLPVRHGAGVLVFYVLLFELVLPRLTASATADPLDAAAYAAGGVLFQVSLNVPGDGGTCGPS